MSGLTPNRSIAMDRSAADMLSEFYMKFFRRIAMKRVHRMQRHVRAVEGYVRLRAWMTMAAGSATNAWHHDRTQ